MKVKVYGGREGKGIEWEEEFELDSDITDTDLEFMARGLSEDFMIYNDVDTGKYNCWYKWEVTED